MSEALEPPPALPNIFYVAVAELPANFQRVAEWVDAVVCEHPQMLGIRGLIDCSRLSSQVPPSVSYLEELAVVMRPLMMASPGTRCAILVADDAILWRARIFESVTSGSRIAFRAFRDKTLAFAWLAREDDSQGTAA